MATSLININRQPLECQNSFDILIQRPTIWGNPYKASVYGRTEALRLYRDYLLGNPDLLCQLYKLYNKVLACGCSPLPCHGDLLVKICNSFKVIVAGDRNYTNYEYIKEVLDSKLIKKLPDTTIISGGQTGVDTLANRYAKHSGLINIEIPADWSNRGAIAGPERNRKMAKLADACIIFDGGGPGSRSMKNIAKEYKLQLRIIKL